MALGHETNTAFNRHCLRMINVAVILGLSAQNITDANTVAGLKTKIADLAVHEADEKILQHVQSALQAAKDCGVIADADIASLTTVAGLRAVFTTNDSTLTATDASCFAYSPRSGSV